MLYITYIVFLYNNILLQLLYYNYIYIIIQTSGTLISTEVSITWTSLSIVEAEDPF